MRGDLMLRTFSSDLHAVPYTSKEITNCIEKVNLNDQSFSDDYSWVKWAQVCGMERDWYSNKWKAYAFMTKCAIDFRLGKDQIPFQRLIAFMQDNKNVEWFADKFIRDDAKQNSNEIFATGSHEWLLCKLTPEALKRSAGFYPHIEAVVEYGCTLGTVDWLCLQAELRTPTKYILFKNERETIESGHPGAVRALDRQGRKGGKETGSHAFHKELENAFFASVTLQGFCIRTLNIFKSYTISGKKRIEASKNDNQLADGTITSNEEEVNIFRKATLYEAYRETNSMLLGMAEIANTGPCSVSPIESDSSDEENQNNFYDNSEEDEEADPITINDEDIPFTPDDTQDVDESIDEEENTTLYNEEVPVTVPSSPVDLEDVPLPTITAIINKNEYLPMISSANKTADKPASSNSENIQNLNTTLEEKKPSISAEIIIAAQSKNIEQLISLIEAHPDLVNVVDEVHKVPSLIWCMLEGLNETAKDLLLRFNADPYFLNNPHIGNKTALHFACHYGSDVIVELLIKNYFIKEHSFLINQQDWYGMTPLHRAIKPYLSKSQETILKCIQHLINVKADLKIKDNEGNTALHLAILNNLPQVVKIIMNAKDFDYNNLHVKNVKDETPLSLASDSKNELISLFVQNKQLECDLINEKSLSAELKSISEITKKEYNELILIKEHIEKKSHEQQKEIEILTKSYEIYKKENKELISNKEAIERKNDELQNEIKILSKSNENLETSKRKIIGFWKHESNANHKKDSKSYNAIRRPSI